MLIQAHFHRNVSIKELGEMDFNMYYSLYYMAYSEQLRVEKERVEQEAKEKQAEKESKNNVNKRPKSSRQELEELKNTNALNSMTEADLEDFAEDMGLI